MFGPLSPLPVHRLLPFVLVIAACGATPTGSSPVAPAPTSVQSPSTTTTSTLAEAPSPLADKVVPLGSAVYDPAALVAPPPVPVSLTVEGLGIDEATVVPVGVEPNGEMQIPGAREVGWYRFGPTPAAEEGSAVLAAHIAWNGTDGVFRRLDDVEVGAIVTVRYDDDSTSRHMVSEIERYPKEELPFDRVFAKTGPRILTMITCGGAFDRTTNSYDDNIVVYAVPLD